MLAEWSFLGDYIFARGVTVDDRYAGLENLRAPIGPRAKFDTALLIDSLSDDQLYSPKCAAATMYHRVHEPIEYARMKSRLYAFASSRQLRNCRDGEVDGIPAWHGSTWKEILGEYELARGRLILDLTMVLGEIIPTKFSSGSSLILYKAEEYVLTPRAPRFRIQITIDPEKIWRQVNPFPHLKRGVRGFIQLVSVPDHVIGFGVILAFLLSLIQAAFLREYPSTAECLLFLVALLLVRSMRSDSG